MREITGRHVLAITVGAFAVIIGVNVLMAWQAVATFPGLEVKNSYVASQEFEAQREAQDALAWSLAPEYDAAARQLRLVFSDSQGLPVQVQDLTVLVGRTTGAADDQTPAFIREAGAYVAPVTLEAGKWMLMVKAFAEDGTLFQQRLDLLVKG